MWLWIVRPIFKMEDFLIRVRYSLICLYFVQIPTTSPTEIKLLSLLLQSQSPAVISQGTWCLCFYFKHTQTHKGLDGSPSGRSIILPLLGSIKRFHAWQMEMASRKRRRRWRCSAGQLWSALRGRRMRDQEKRALVGGRGGEEWSWIIHNWRESGCCWKDNGGLLSWHRLRFLGGLDEFTRRSDIGNFLSFTLFFPLVLTQVD